MSPKYLTVILLESLSQLQFVQLLRSRDTFRGPPTRAVVLRKHLGNAAYEALRRSGLNGLLVEALGQCVILRRETGLQVELALEVPDALASLDVVGWAVLYARQGAEHRGVIIRDHPKRAEDTSTGRIHRGRHILECLRNRGLPLDLTRIEPHAVAQHFNSYGVTLHMTAATIASGILEANPLNAARVICWHLLLLYRHRKLGMTVQLSESIRTQ